MVRKMQGVSLVVSCSRKVVCNGDCEELNHPVVYLYIKEEETSCPYCNKKFVYKPDQQ